MRSLLERAWPRSLAGRLVACLIGALLAAQVLLALVLRWQQDSVTAQMVHGQALQQTVALARLLQAYPAADAARLTEAFGSRGSCARLSPGVAMDRPMTSAEQALSRVLATMLHGVEAGPPLVTIEPLGPDRHPCGGERVERGGARGVDRTAAVTMSVPLADGRAFTVRTAVSVPALTRATVLSFLLSSLAVSLAAILAVRWQTRSLRALAVASERFGRGETVGALALDGPSDVTAATAAFNTMQARLDGYLRDRLNLLAAVSHDLRTPLTTLRLKAEFIDDEATREDVIRTIDELTVICEATLAFTRAEAATEASAPMDLRALATSVAEDLRIAGADIRVGPFERAVLAVRPVALRRALRNLLENAVRYGGGAVLTGRRGPDGGLVLTVDDNGPGLPPDAIEEAFKPFVRLDPSRSTDTGGLGLGLAIARSIAKAHGGTLTLGNRPEGGLRAELALPARSGQADGQG